MMKFRTCLILFALVGGSSAALAQITPPPAGIPNGLSGPGGTVTFSAAPTIQTNPTVTTPIVPQNAVPAEGRGGLQAQPRMKTR